MKLKKNKKPQLPRSRRRRFLRWLIAVMAFGAGMTGGGLLWLSRDLPSADRLRVITPSLKTQVLDRNGDVYGSFGIENRLPIPLEEMSPHIVNAALSVEDKRFYRHWGVDLVRWPKILVKDIGILLRNRNAPLHGGSTLTQQLARDLFLTREQTVIRKIKELMLAMQIERTYAKDEILEMYLNQIYFGAGSWGVEATSQTLFGKGVGELKAEEAALIIGMAKNPWGYDPRRFPDRSRERRDTALVLMQRNGHLSRVECDSLCALPLDVLPRNTTRDKHGRFFLEEVRRYIMRRYGSDRLYRGGLTVRTTIDPDLQIAAEEAVSSWLTEIEARMGYEDTYASISAALDSGLTVPASRQYIQAATILVDAETGAIRAQVGGRDFSHSEFNRAVQAARQPGSAFKPFVYLAALEHGLAPSDLIMDTPVVVEIPGQKKPYKPRNHSGKFLGEITLRHALNKSINVPAIRLIQQLGPVTTINYARKAGVDSDLPPVLSLALGSAEVTLQEMTRAYATLAAGGIRSEPYSVVSVVDRWGRVLEEHQMERRAVIDEKSAYLITNMLETVLSNGTAIRARAMGFRHPAAGKTGTTDSNLDAWFVGYSPRYVCGVWVGYDEKKPMGKWMEGSHAALPIWTLLMKEAHQGLPLAPFEIPEGISTLAVCAESGLLPTRYCEKTKEEVFISSRQPRRSCDRHSPSGRGPGIGFRQIDRQTIEDDAEEKLFR